MPKASVNGIDIDYQEYGPEDGNPEAIIFAHGAGGNLLSWFQQIPYFSINYRCVTFSHRGFGHSYDIEDGPGMNAFPEDLEALMDFLNIEKAHLVAQSMGGRTALGFAVINSNRVLSLTLADTTGAMGEEDVEMALSEWRQTHPDTRGIGFRALSDDFRTRKPEMSNLYLQISRTNPMRDASVPILFGGPKGDKLSDLDMPVLFIVGKDDLLTPPHVLNLASKHIPGASLICVPGCGHSVYFEKPDVFNFEVGRFISAASSS